MRPPKDLVETSPSKKQWPILPATLLAGFLPATTARRSTSISLRTVFLFHILAALFGAVEILVIAAWADFSFSATGFRGWWYACRSLFSQNFSPQVQPIFVTIGYVALVAAMIEITFLALAFIFTPWGARANETIRQSFRHSLRQTWLHTGHLCFCIALFATAVIAEELAPPMPRIFPDSGWHNLHRVFFVLYNTASLCLLWALWSLLRGIGARTTDPFHLNSYLCDRCGYDLTGSVNRCPECGLPFQRFIGSDFRPGCTWNERKKKGRWVAFWKTTKTALFHSHSLGRNLQLSSNPTDHRRFLAIHFPLAYLIAFCGLLLNYIVAGKQNAFQTEPELFSTIGPTLGAFSIAGTVVLTCIAASLAGSYYSLKTKRNLLPCAIQVACYQSGFLVAWLVFAAAMFGVVIVLECRGVFRMVAQMSRLSADTLAQVTWWIPALVSWFIFIALVFRGTSAMKYANR